jgi:hypothetical protein
MNNLENAYRKAAINSTVENYYPEYTSYLSEDLFIDEAKQITEDVAIKFAEWCDTSDFVQQYWRKNKVEPTMDGSHHLIIQERRKKLFELFIEKYYEQP